MVCACVRVREQIGTAMMARLDTTAAPSVEQTQLAYSAFTAEHKAEHLPDAVVVLPSTAQLRLLLTVTLLTPHTGVAPRRRSAAPTVQPLLTVLASSFAAVRL